MYSPFLLERSKDFKNIKKTNNMTKAIKVITVIVVIFFMSSIANAQFNGGGGVPGGGGGGGGLPPAGVPFDGGLSLILLAAGAGLSANKKRLKQNS